MSTVSPTTHALLALVRSALGLAGTPAGGSADVKENPAVDWNALSEADWQEILQMARKQTVTGLLFRGVANLPAEVQVPDSLLFPLMEETDRIRRQSRLVERTAKEITEFFEGRILHPVILKGPSVACFYPEPDLRESGDIDLYFNEKEFGKAVHAIRERLQKDGQSESLTTLPDGSVHYKWNGIDIDQHAQYFDLSSSEGLPPVPSPEATLLMLSAHILKHSMGAGIGLRQLCDMAMAYERIRYDQARLLACYEATGTAFWTSSSAAATSATTKPPERKPSRLVLSSASSTPPAASSAGSPSRSDMVPGSSPITSRSSSKATFHRKCNTLKSKVLAYLHAVILLHDDRLKSYKSGDYISRFACGEKRERRKPLARSSDVSQAESAIASAPSGRSGS